MVNPAGLFHFPVAHPDSTDGFLAAVRVTVDSGGDFVAGNLTAVNLAQINGITASAASDFNVANFDFIP